VTSTAVTDDSVRLVAIYAAIAVAGLIVCIGCSGCIVWVYYVSCRKQDTFKQHLAGHGSYGSTMFDEGFAGCGNSNDNNINGNHVFAGNTNNMSSGGNAPHHHVNMLMQEMQSLRWRLSMMESNGNGPNAGSSQPEQASIYMLNPAPQSMDSSKLSANSVQSTSNGGHARNRVVNRIDAFRL